RWHVYFLGSEIALKAWPTAKADIQRALAVVPKLTFNVDLDQDTFATGDDIAFAITMRNRGSKDIDVPELYWAARVVLDGKEYKRLPNTGVWRGPGTMSPNGAFQIGGQAPAAPGVRHVQPGPTLSQYGIGPTALGSGEHKLSLRIGDDESNDLTTRILPKASLRSNQEVAALGDQPRAPATTQALLKPTLLLPDHWIVMAVGFDHEGKELVTAATQSFVTIRRWD